MRDFVKADYKGSDLLDTYIARHFAEQAQFGRYSVLAREGARRGE